MYEKDKPLKKPFNYKEYIYKNSRTPILLPPWTPILFLHRIYTSGVKIKPKNSRYIFHKVEKVKSRYCENNYDIKNSYSL